MIENNATGQLNIPEELENSLTKKDDRKPFDVIASEALVELYKQVNKQTNENNILRKNLEKQEIVLKDQQEIVGKQEKKLEGMITQQSFTDKSVKILNGLLVGSVVGVILLIVGIVYDLVRDNRLYELYNEKVEKLQEQLINDQYFIIKNDILATSTESIK